MIKNLALVLVSVLLGLAFAEAISRLIYADSDKQVATFRVTRSGIHQDDAQLGWVPKPLQHGEHPLPHNATTRFSTNSLGLRGPEVPTVKPEGVQRIVVVGDSFVWGWGIDDGQTFPDQLGAGRSDRQIINLGVIGYGLLQEMQYFQRMAAALAPDAVVLSFCENDVVATTVDFHRHGGSGSDSSTGLAAQGSYGVATKLKRWLSQSSALYRLANDVVMSNKSLMRLAVQLHFKDGFGGYDELDDNLRPFLTRYPSDLDRQWRLAMQELLEFKQWADANGIRFIVAVIPALQSVEDDAFRASLASSSYEPADFDLDRPYVALAEFCRENRIELVNPVTAFREAESRHERLYLVGDMHFNPQGHRLFAKAISDELDAPITADRR